MDNMKPLGLSIAHLNVRGVVNKTDKLKLYVDNLGIKVFHVSETFLNSNIDSSLLNIPNYFIARRDRNDRHGGGVLTYIHSSLKFVVLEEFDSILPESLTLCITQNSSKSFISSVVYRPPNSRASWLDQFSDYVSKCKDKCEDLILTGDFNVNLFSQNKKWNNMVNQLGLFQVIQQPTRVQSSQTLIDHTYITKPNNLIQHGTHNITLSNQYMAYVHRKLRSRTRSPKTTRKIHYLDWQSFCAT